MRRSIALVALTAVLASACGGGEEEGEFRAIALSGHSEYLDGDEWRSLVEEIDLSRGESVRTGVDGRLLVRLPKRRTVELAPNSELSILGPSETLLLRGSALGSTPDALGIGLGQVTVRGIAGMFRVDAPGQVKVYQGSASLPGSGWEGSIDPLREAVLVSGGVSRVLPLTVDPGDLWEASLFGEAIEIGDRLGRLERGLKRQFPDRPRPTAVARAIPGDVPTKAVRNQLRRRPVTRWAEVAVASAVASGVGGDRMGDALRGMLGLRDLGASWIVIAAEWQLSDTVLSAVGKFSASLARVLAAIARSQVGGGGSGGGAAGGGSAGAPPGGGGGPAPPPSGGPGPGTPPRPECPDGDVVCETVDGVLDPLPTAPALP